ncbi:MAG: LacI family DNA-binding transcriptional regulator [Pseudomonadota bacterium]
MKSRATIRSIAEATGYSVMTVSNVLNKKPGVSEKTRKLILREIDKQRYVPTQAGRSLRAARQWSIGFIMVDPSELYLADYLNGQVAASLSRTLNDSDYTLSIRLCRPGELADTTIFRRLSVDGMIVVVGGQDARAAIAEPLMNLGVPVVAVQGPVPAGLDDAMSVRQDDRAGGMLLADHLAARGVASVLAVLTEDEWPSFESRLAGLKAGLKATRDGASVSVLRVSSEAADVARAEIHDWLSRHTPPAAVFGGNDALAYAAIRALGEQGLSVPDDVMVTGFNALDFASLFSPSLTTVRSRGRELGEMAATAMLERLQQGRFSRRSLTLPVSLQVGDSTRRSS